MNEGWLVCKTTAGYLAGLDEIIIARLQSEKPGVAVMAQTLIRKGGKRIRPALLLLAGSFGSSPSKDLLYPAAAMEMIHVASLYHDDVMDEAAMRRQAPSVNNAYGNDVAIQAGSFVFARAMSLLADTRTDLGKIISRSVSDLCLGQLRESEYRHDVSNSVDHYLTVIQQKTASLFELPCSLGTRLAGSGPGTIEALQTYGKNLGMAFQIVDDLLDLTGDEATMGKQPGADLREGVYTFATLFALNRATVRKELAGLLLLDRIADEELKRAVSIIKDSGGVGEARRQARNYIKAAEDALEILPSTPARESLFNLSKYVTERSK
ncbi:polyprenyl synthetase family protein [bacterium]|nr:MAG: polyprenyl synthetase family protein [bacterium]